MSTRLIHGRFETVSLDDIGDVDLIIADPPDNIGRAYDGVHDDSRPTHEYRDLMCDWLRIACSFDCPVFLIFNENHIGLVEFSIAYGGHRLIQRLWWYWTFGVCHQQRYTPCMRPIYWLNKPTIYPDAIRVPSKRQVIYGDKRAKAEGRLPDTFWGHGDDYGMLTVWKESRVCGTYKERVKWHDNQINREIYRRIIRGHSLPGQRVLDPMIGSGTCAYVCEEEGRNCVGIDASQNYLDNIARELREREAITEPVQ